MRKGPGTVQSLLTMLWTTSPWRQLAPRENRPYVNKTVKDDVICPGTMRDKKDDIGAPTLRLRERTHHAHYSGAVTQLQRILLHLRRGGTMATIRRSESFVRTLGTAPGKYGSTSDTLRARPVTALHQFHHRQVSALLYEC